MGIFRSMGGVNLTGERIALGRGRSLDVLTVETNRTGPLPPGALSSSSSVELEESLPESLDSLPLEELELLDVEVELPALCLPRPPFLVIASAGMRGGTVADDAAAVEMVVMWTPPTVDTCGEDWAGLDEGCTDLWETGRRWGAGAEEEEDRVCVVRMQVDDGGISVEMELMG